MNDARIIKRYANRKLYDTLHSRYVTLDQISEMIRNGDDVKIIDNKTKEDLTSVTLAQIIFEEEKKQRSFLPLQAMRNIIQNGGESFAQLVTEAQRRVTSIFPGRKDEDSEIIDELDPEPVDAKETAITEEVVAMPAGDESSNLSSWQEFRDWLEESRRTIDDWQKRVDDRIRNVVEGISPFGGLHKDVKALSERIADLEAKLDALAVSETATVATEVTKASEPTGPVIIALSADESQPARKDIN